MEEKERQQVTHKLMILSDQAQDLYNSVDELFTEYNLYANSSLTPALDKAYNLVAAFKAVIDAQQRAGEPMIRAAVTGWYEFRYEDDEEPGAVQFESVTYEGNNVWTATISTKLQGREKVTVHSDAATYADIYEAVKLEERHSQEEVKLEIRQALALRQSDDPTAFRQLAGVQSKLASWIPKNRIDGPTGFHAVFGQWLKSANPEQRIDSISQTIYLMLEEEGR